MKLVSQEVLLTIARNVTENLAAEIGETRDGAHYLAAIGNAAARLQKVLAARLAVDAGVSDVSDLLGRQDETRRGALAHLQAIAFDADQPAAVRADAGAVRRVLEGRSSGTRSHAARIAEGPQAREALAALGVAVDALPPLGGRTVAARIDAYFEACDAVARVLLSREARVAGPSTMTLRAELKTLVDALRLAIDSESRVNPRISDTLVDRIVEPAARSTRVRRARTAAALASAA
jgi:hypothetical protein